MGPNNMAGRSPGFANVKNSDFNNVGFSDKQSLIVTTSWISICIAILVTVLFWLLDSSAVSSYKTKQKQKDLIISDIASSDFAVVDRKVSGFKSAYDEIKKALSEKFVMGDFLTDLYSVINTDVSIRNISVTSDGKLNIDGVAESYRSVSDQMLSLKSLANLQNIELLSASMSTSSSGKTEVPFVFGADILKTDTVGTSDNSGLSVPTTNTSNTNSSSAPTLDTTTDQTGGTNATQ